MSQEEINQLGVNKEVTFFIGFPSDLISRERIRFCISAAIIQVSNIFVLTADNDLTRELEAKSLKNKPISSF